MLALCTWLVAEMRPVMCEADHNPQIGHSGTCDLLIGLFAHTMGGTLPERGPFRRHPDGRLWPCAEWEVAQALEGKHTGAVKSAWRIQDARPQPDPPKGGRSRRTVPIANRLTRCASTWMAGGSAASR